MSVNSRLKVIQIIGQRKAFYRQRIPQSGCARKEAIDIVILITSRNGGKKIMQSIRITSRPPSRIRKWNQFRQFTRRSAKVIPVEKTQAGYISMMSQESKRGSKWWTNSPACLFLQLIQEFQIQTRSTSADMTTVFHAWSYGRFIGIQSNSGE